MLFIFWASVHKADPLTQEQVASYSLGRLEKAGLRLCPKAGALPSQHSKPGEDISMPSSIAASLIHILLLCNTLSWE